jgi:hypothetical protein
LASLKSGISKIWMIAFPKNFSRKNRFFN